MLMEHAVITSVKTADINFCLQPYGNLTAAGT